MKSRDKRRKVKGAANEIPLTVPYKEVQEFKEQLSKVRRYANAKSQGFYSYHGTSIRIEDIEDAPDEDQND